MIWAAVSCWMMGEPGSAGLRVHCDLPAGLLARDEPHRQEGLQGLTAMLAPHIPGAAQRAAIKALGVSGAPSVPNLLSKAWPMLGPETRLAILDELLSREPWAMRSGMM